MRRALALLAGLCALAFAGSAAARARFDTQVVAIIPPPGYPALAYLAPGGRIYEGTYENPSGDTVPSRVLEYTADGILQRSWTVLGQDLSQPHGVQVATSDARGDLVLLDKTPARALLLDPRTGKQSTYSTFADLPTCAPGATSTTAQPCSPAKQDLTPMPDYGAWGPDGSLYVTDYQQAVIWRVPPRGGAAKVWLADPRLDGNMFGTAGIVLGPDHRTLYFTQASSAGEGGLTAGGLSLPGSVNPSTGKLYSVTIGGDGTPGPLVQHWESGPAEAPDGFAIARSGDVYIALAGPANQLVEVGPDGSEKARFPSSSGSGDNGSAVPFDTPSSAMFLGTALLVANQGYISGNAQHMAILNVEVGEPGFAPYIPASAGPASPPPPPAPKSHHKKRPKPRPRKKPHKHPKRPAKRHRGEDSP